MKQLINGRGWAALLLMIVIGSSVLAQAQTLNQIQTPKKASLRIALFHLSPKLGALQHNTEWIAWAMKTAASHGADWVITPELAITGYKFAPQIGTDWLQEDDRYVQQLQTVAAELGVALLLGHPERDPTSHQLYNSLWVIDRQGKVVATHRKINTIPIAEAWASKGDRATLVQLDGYALGLLVCADAWPQEHAASLKQQGAQLVINAATWPPGQYGPATTWEKRSQETGIPWFVNNRTGVEPAFDIRQAETLVSFRGQRILTHTSDHSALILVEWDMKHQELLSSQTITIP